jgi:prepilin-type N-terminal cleavage/methylation domain-containing protein
MNRCPILRVLLARSPSKGCDLPSLALRASEVSVRTPGKHFPARGQRPAFTLLEVLLASAIGVLLMAALYVAMDVQLRHAHAGREVVEHSTLARQLFARVVNDIIPSMAPAIPSTSSSSGSSGSSGASTTGTTSTASTSSTSTSGSSSTTSSTSSTSTSNTTTTSSGPPSYNFNVQGDSGRLTLNISRLPRELDTALNPGVDPTIPAQVTDMRRITYWLVGAGSDTPQGLARQEINLIASDDQMSALPPDIPDEANFVLAPEVKSVTFSYWDGTSWYDTWDGTQPGSDGTTPMGPPMLIAIVLGIAPADGQGDLKTYRHSIALPTANGLPQSTTTTTSQ